MQTPEVQVTAQPARPAGKLHPVAEAVIAAVGETYKIGNGGVPGAAEAAKRRMLAAFADIGLSPEYVARIAQVLR